MPILRKGCCCLRLQTCALIVCGIHMVGLMTLNLQFVGLYTPRTITGRVKHEPSPWDVLRGRQTFFRNPSYLYNQAVFSLIGLILVWINTVVIIVGVLKKKQRLLKIFCVLDLVLIALFNISMIYSLTSGDNEPEDIRDDILHWIIGNLIETYVLLCIFSYYQELLEEARNPRTGIPFYTPAPQMPVVGSVYYPSPAQGQVFIKTTTTNY